MTWKVREALRQAASVEHRTMASLLNKIVADYLEKHGYLAAKSIGQERRKYPRIKTALPSVTYHKAGTAGLASISCVVLDLSLGGALIVYPRGSEIKDAPLAEMPNFTLCFKLPRVEDDVSVKCDPRRVFNIDNGLKIGAAFIDLGESQLSTLGAYLS
jgi:hypothetical protein